MKIPDRPTFQPLFEGLWVLWITLGEIQLFHPLPSSLLPRCQVPFYTTQPDEMSQLQLWVACGFSTFICGTK